MLATGVGLKDSQAQQSAPRAYAPPVHIAPGSATSLPVNRYRSRSARGLELANTQDESRSMGLQDRLANGLSRKRTPNPALAREIPVGIPQQKTVGSGLIKSSRVQRVERFESHEPVRSMVEDEGGNDSYEVIQTANAQESETTAPPARHAFVQDEYLRNLPPRVANQPQEEVQFGQEFQWAEEQPNLPGTDRQSQQINRQQDRVPARPTSVFRRQDTQPQDSDFQPQPSLQGEQPKSDFQQELERLDKKFEEKMDSGLEELNPAQGSNDRPKSLLENESEVASDDRADDQNSIGGDKSKNSLLNQTCSEFRSDLLNTSIRDIALDISPPAINTNQPYIGISRSWTDRNGQIIATGTMMDLRRGYVFLDNGQKIAFARLSEADLTAVAEHWNLPKSCLVASSGTVVRCWQPQAYHWTASSLCHKPLYFENIQLERYGHTHGPIMQPVRSVAHFFVSLVTLPYQSAIHPANECEYPLGLYRPGDCAPWLKDPIPISLDGLRRQGLVTTGLAFIP